MLTSLAIEGYRSIRDLVVPLHPLTVVTGANGSGKSSLYRSLRLLAATGRDGAVAALAREGGLASTLWAGPEAGGRSGGQGTLRRGPVGLRLGVGSDDDGFGYAIDLGLPTADRQSLFGRDPEIKAEAVWAGASLRPAALLCERRGAMVRLRDDDGWRIVPRQVPAWESVLDSVGDPDSSPELLALRSQMRDWRFYDAMRTDTDAPARRPAIGTRTPILASDGRDLAASLQTIREHGDARVLDDAVDAAFPGSRVAIDSDGGIFRLSLTQPGLLRPLSAAELSDGTLRYLLWAAAFLGPRPAGLLAVNEPENSLHPEVLGALAGLLVTAAGRSQLVVVTHSARLVELLAARGAVVHELHKVDGETRLLGQGVLDAPPWRWPSR